MMFITSSVKYGTFEVIIYQIMYQEKITRFKKFRRKMHMPVENEKND